MTKKFTLDDIRDAAEEKYGSTHIEINGTDVELINVLRLPKEKRNIILNLAKDKDKGEVDIDETRESLLKGLRAACKTTAQADVLSEALGDDTALVMQVLSLYTRETEVGEASPSQD